MHNKISESVEFNHDNRSIRKSKSTSNLSVISKKKLNNIKIEIDMNEPNKSPSTENKINGNISPNHRRRQKRSSINNNSLLSTVTTVHELMSFIIHKDNPPSWLKQTDLYKEYTTKSQQIHTESLSSSSHYHQQLHRKQRCNLQMYARSSQSWQSLSSTLLISPTIKTHSNETINKINLSPIQNSTSIIDYTTPLNISIKSKSSPKKQTTITRRKHMLCQKKLPQNYLRRRPRMNSVENQEPLEKKDSSSTSSSQNDSNLSSSSSSSSSSIEHTSPSPTTTVSALSSHHSSPTEYMRTNSSLNTRLSSPLRIQTSISPDIQTLSTPQRRSARIWAPSNFYINPMWIIPSATTTTAATSSSSSSKRLLVQNSSPSPSETNKRPRRRCRS